MLKNKSPKSLKRKEKSLRTYLEEHSGVRGARVCAAVAKLIPWRILQTPLTNHYDIIILIASYGAATGMIAPFAVSACSVEVFDYSTTLRERTKARMYAAARVTRLPQRRSTRLDEDGIDVRRTM